MKFFNVNRNWKVAVTVAVTALLVGGVIGCRKKPDESSQADHSAMQHDHGSMTGMNMSMPGMDMSSPTGQSMSGMKMTMPAASNAPASREMKMDGMDMSAGEHSGHIPSTNNVVPGRTPVDLDQAQRQFINIRTRPVTRGDAVVSIRTVGIVAYDDTRLVNVNTRIMGWAQKLYVDKPGQFVEKGAPLMDIYSPELYSAQYEYLLAFRHCERLKHVMSPTNTVANTAIWHESMNEAETLMESARKRLKLWEIGDDEITALEKSGKPTDTLQLKAPVTGYVIEKNIDPAQMIMSGKTLYRVADLSGVWINADIYEYELPFVKVGQKVQVTALAHPGRTFSASVDFIYPYSENKTRTTTIRLVMDNREERFKPNDYVNAEIKVDQGKRLLVPSTATYDTGVSQYVFVEATEGHFVPRRVELGPTVGDQVVVNKGLAEGEKVVVDGNFLLDSESQLRASASGGGHQH